MLQIMLCGASDTDMVSPEFAEVVSQFGADPWHYLAGHILHINSATASWDRNSGASVDAADMCVFVIVERYGAITWATELERALETGKPMLIFCLRKTYDKYLALSRSISDLKAIDDENDRRLVVTLRELESERQLSVISYAPGFFREELRRGLAMTFREGLKNQTSHNLRSALLAKTTGTQKLSLSELARLAEIATDETEEKLSRKQAVRSLAHYGVPDTDVILALLTSLEQGVQRIAVQELEGLYRTRPVEPAFLASCVAIANGSDDVGVARRLIAVLLDLDLSAGIAALSELDVSEIGARRRLAAALEDREAELRIQHLGSKAQVLLRACLSDAQSGWISRGKKFDDRISGWPPDED